MLEVDNVHTYYGDSYVLQGVSLHVDEGQVVVLLGRNGVGKTTLFRSIMGLTPPARGRVVFQGRDVTGWPPYRIVGQGISLVPQGRRIFHSLSVRENLEVAERPARNGSGKAPWTTRRILEWFPRLQERERQGGGKLSGGEQQMLACGRALVGNPRLLVMDEPTEGLAPLIVNQVEELIHQLKSQGISILLAEQRFGFALAVADYVYVLSQGRIVHESTPAALEHNEPVKRAYLGV
ncbi:MAG TPA: ABC transporter ATP-binding protein [Chloroflexota bacterium]|nr:ABC transporter ATP-binding protein [Chloroflexota bacterium]